MTIIYKKLPSKFVETDKKAADKKKPAGLGRSFDSLLEDNSPDISTKPLVIRRDDGSGGNAESNGKNKVQTDNLYKK